jgi:hypothetical protein
MDFSSVQIHLIPTKIAQFGRPQTMTKGGHDHRCVPKAVPVALGRFFLQPAHFGFGQVFAPP